MDRAMADHQAHVKHMHVQNEDAKESIINAPRNTLTDIATTPTRKYDVAGSAQQHHHHHHHFHRLLNNNNNNNNNNIVSECSANFRSNQSGVVGINVHVDASPKMLLPTPTNSNSSFSEGPPSALKSMLSREEEEERWHCTEEEDGVMVMGATPTPKTWDADDAMDALLAHSNSSECGGYLHDDFALLPASSSALSIRSAPMSEDEDDEDDDDDDDECSAKPLTMGTNINNRNHGDAEKHDVCSVMRRDLRRCPPDQHPYLDMHRQQLLHADDRQKHHARYLSIMASGLGFLSETDSAISAKIILREAHRLHRHRRRARTNLFSSNHTIPTNSSMASTASSCTTSTDAAATSSSPTTTTPPLHFTEVELDTSPAALEMQWRIIQREVSDDLRTMGLGFVQNRLSCMCLFDPHRLARAYGDNRRCLRMRLEAQEEVLCKLREQARQGGNAFFLDEHNNNNTFTHNMSVEKNVGVHGDDDDDDHVSTMKEQQDDDVAPQWEPIQWESAASGATTSCACGADGAEEEEMHRVDQPLPSAPKIEGHSAKAAPSSSILPRVRGGDGKPPSFRKR